MQKTPLDMLKTLAHLVEQMLDSSLPIRIHNSDAFMKEVQTCILEMEK